MIDSYIMKFSIIIFGLIFVVAEIDGQNTIDCPCINGVCSIVEEESRSKCFCHDGFTGDDCSINFDECLPGRNPCHNGK